LATAAAAWWNQGWLKEEIFALLNATALTTTQERALKRGDALKECRDCPEMIVVSAGRFKMGSPTGQGSDWERPQHNVIIAKSFAAAKFELTFDEWDACAAHGDCDLHMNASGWGARPAPGDQCDLG
jgi:formylglycine-generating enzyme required for sulfatase activity